MMACGHAANATDVDGKPCCAICYGLKGADSETVIHSPNLKGRTAECSMCDRKEPSDMDLAFFEHRPSRPTDLYYCGCKGWD
jgi:hypothetical protein